MGAGTDKEMVLNKKKKKKRLQQQLSITDICISDIVQAASAQAQWLQTGDGTASFSLNLKR